MKKILMLFPLILLSACDLRVLDPASDSAETLTDLIYLSFGLMMIVFATVIILFIQFVRKYKETPDKEDVIPEGNKENKWFEFAWTVLPILLLVVLAVPTVRATYDLTAKLSADEMDVATEGINVEVTAERFSWTFTYENGKKSVGELALPVGKEANFRLTSKDVIHSFWVPNLSGKIDAIPGEVTKLSFTPNETGSFDGKCAEFCGVEHTKMRFQTKVMSEENFQAWLQAK